MTQPTTSAGPTPLDNVERLVAHARHTMTRLAVALTARPIDRALYGELQLFLDRHGFAACDAMDQLAARGVVHLRARLAQLAPLVDPAKEVGS